MKPTMVLVTAATLALALAAGASSAGDAKSGSAEAPPTSQTPEAYVPGLGEIMGGIQLRHAKLWFAGRARNWELAGYELGEIKEAFGDAAKYQPQFKGRPVAEMIGPITGAALASLDKAIAAKDAAQFATAYDQLTSGCNSCHQGAGYGFIAIRRPVSEPLTNQRFKPLGKP